jgi:hypothetical protein
MFKKCYLREKKGQDSFSVVPPFLALGTSVQAAKIIQPRPRACGYSGPGLSQVIFRMTRFLLFLRERVYHSMQG